MPRAPNPQVDEARKLYQKGHKLTEIAAKLGVPDGTVRRWKSTYKWDSERSDSKASVRNDITSVRKRGGQPNNKNARGNKGGAPVGNDNAEKHGIYRRRLWRTFSPEDQEALDDMPTDEETLLLDQLRELSWLEMDCLQSIEKYQNISGGLAIHDVEKKTGDKEGTATKVVTTFEYLHKLNDELLKIQNAKRRVITELRTLRISREKLKLLKLKQEASLPQKASIVDVSNLTDEELRELAKEAAESSS